MTAQCAFLGLGVMGYPMAGHLQKAGYAVTVYNRTAEKAENWSDEYGGSIAPTPAQAVSNADFIFTCVGDDDDLRAVAQAAYEGAKQGAIFIDHTTSSALVARELAGLYFEKNIAFLDAPVSGGEIGAIKGQLTIMIGGEKAAYEKASPLLDSYARAHRLMGESGAGQLTKMVNQICIGGLLQGLSEALHFGETAGLDMPAVLEVISKGAAQSWQMENRGETMLKGEFNFGFAVDWMRKDLEICLAQANALGVTLPITAIINDYYKDVQKMGGTRWDTSSLIQRLRKD